ncbi:uncharacterized protein [Nicotiana tomentosiformis]|uniref:uncharacterized protein n=1 Tax=Nicotiana tomentosiformis TaxID=4098 RepID=UPI00388CC2A7
MSSEALWRLDRFTKLFPVHFSGSPSEDPQDYLDSCHEVLLNMGIVETYGVDFAIFQMTGSAKKWWRYYLLTRPAGSPGLTWDRFSQLFLEKFITLRDEHHRQFKHLQQGSAVANVARRVEMVLVRGGQGFYKRPRYSGEFSGASSKGRGTFGSGHPPRPFHSALQESNGASGGRGPQMHYSDQVAYSALSTPISAPPLQSYQGGYSDRKGQFQGQQSQQPRLSYTCGDPRHIARVCPWAMGSSQYQSSRAIVPAPVAAPPAQPARGRGQAARGRGQTV